MDATMAAHQHNYSSLRYPGWPLDEGQVLYSNARRGGASEHEPKGRRGCRTPGPTEEEVEGCRLTVGTRDVVGGDTWKPDDGRTTGRTRKRPFDRSTNTETEEITSSCLTSLIPYVFSSL